MRTIKTTAIAALLTATIGASSVLPVFAQEALAQATTNAAQPQPDASAPARFRGAARGGDMLNFSRGAEAIEIALVRLSHRTELTAEQQPLFDAFRTAALAAAEVAAASIDPIRTPAGETEAQKTPAQRLADRIALTRAHLQALEAVQPAATAFFNSLTDDQLAQLAPDHAERNHRDNSRFHSQPRQRGHQMAPGQAPRG